MIELASISRALQAPHQPADFVADASHAAVAMILADGARELEACFILRSEREGDPWSGQVALPGGRAEPGDADPAATAMRETMEEVGLDLSPHRQIGPLPVQDIKREGVSRMSLSPFVFHVGDREPQQRMICTSEEVASVFWVPMSRLFHQPSMTTIEYDYQGATIEFPGIVYEDYVIWGLTLGILDSFAGIIGATRPGSRVLQSTQA